MLKLTYVENGFFLERLDVSLEDWISARVFVCVRACAPVYVEPTSAAFLLPADLPNLNALATIASQCFSLTPVDASYVEISLDGTWLAAAPESEEGVFACVMNDRAELIISQLWLEAQLGASVIGD